MKIIEESGDLFTYPGHIAHGANCKGVMGAGVAKGIRSNFPYVYNEYREAYHKGLLVPGMIHPVWVHEPEPEGRWIFNLLTQNKPRATATPHLIYTALSNMTYFCENFGIEEVAAPRIGCGIGGLQWPLVSEFIKAVDSDMILRVFSL